MKNFLQSVGILEKTTVAAIAVPVSTPVAVATPEGGLAQGLKERPEYDTYVSDACFSIPEGEAYKKYETAFMKLTKITDVAARHQAALVMADVEEDAVKASAEAIISTLTTTTAGYITATTASLSEESGIENGNWNELQARKAEILQAITVSEEKIATLIQELKSVDDANNGFLSDTIRGIKDFPLFS